jgi:ribosomal protein S18
MAAEKKADAEKPLDKMTVKELKEIGLSMPELTGVHGMNKQDLLIAIKKARGIEDAPKKTVSTSVKVLKQKISSLKSQHQAVLEAKDARMAKIYRRRISRLKKKTRKA